MGLAKTTHFYAKIDRVALSDLEATGHFCPNDDLIAIRKVIGFGR